MSYKAKTIIRIVCIFEVDEGQDKTEFSSRRGVGGEGYWRRTEGVSYQIADMAQMLADNTVKFLLDRPHTKESKPHKQQTEKLKELSLPFPLFTFPI